MTMANAERVARVATEVRRAFPASWSLGSLDTGATVDKQLREDFADAARSVWNRWKPVLTRAGVAADTDATLVHLHRVIDMARDTYDEMVAKIARLQVANVDLAAEQARLEATVESLRSENVSIAVKARLLELEAAALALRFGPPDPPDDPTAPATCTRKKVPWTWRQENLADPVTGPARWTVDLDALHNDSDPTEETT